MGAYPGTAGDDRWHRRSSPRAARAAAPAAGRWTRPTGWVVVCGGLALVIAAVRERGPGSLEEPGTLVTRGLHGRSRNPMYLGFSMVQVGLAGATRSVWMLASSPVSTALLHQSILREERWRRETFGDAYDAYTAGVPRYW